MKKLTAILLVLVMSLSCMVGVSAATGDGNMIVPFWNYMDSIEVSVDFSGTAGTASVEVTRIFGVTTSLEATLTVYKLVGSEWVFVDDASGNSTRMLAVELDFTAESGVTYKAEANVTAYGANGSETETVSQTKKCP